MAKRCAKECASFGCKEIGVDAAICQFGKRGVGFFRAEDIAPASAQKRAHVGSRVFRVPLNGHGREIIVERRYRTISRAGNHTRTGGHFRHLILMPDMPRQTCAVDVKLLHAAHGLADFFGLPAKHIRHDLMPETHAEQGLALLFGRDQKVTQWLHPFALVIDALV